LRLSRLAAPLALLATVLAVAGGAQATGSTLYLSPSGSDANSCSQSAPCLTFDHAYHAAQPGDTVEVADGAYGPQTITQDLSKDAAGTAHVVFQPAPGAHPVIANSGFKIMGAALELHGIVMDMTGCVDGAALPPCPSITISSKAANATTGAHDVVIDGFKAARFYISAAYNVLIENSDFGPSWDDHGLIHCFGSQNPCTYVPHDITLRNVTMHDFWNTSGCKANVPANCFSTHHQGCAATINNGYNIVEDGLVVWNCEDLPWYLHPYLSTVYDVDVVNSAFLGNLNGQPDHPAQLYSDQAAGGYWNIRIHHSYFEPGLSLLPSTTPNNCSGTGGTGGCEYLGNLGSPRCSGNGGFGPGWTVDFNAVLSSTTACGPNSFLVSSYGLAADGEHFAAGSALCGVLPTQPWSPPTDIDGAARSNPTSPGPDDCGSAAPPPPADTTPPTLVGMPADQTATEPSTGAGAVVTWTDPTATDNVDPSPSVSCSPSSGSTFPAGATVVTCTATDSSGNSASSTFVVSVTAHSCDQACEQSYQDQIATLTQQRDALQARIDAAVTDLTG
jgi:hypothetical protein